MSLQRKIETEIEALKGKIIQRAAKKCNDDPLIEKYLQALRDLERMKKLIAGLTNEP